MPTSSRAVHSFDFDERGLGNLEDIPKYWTLFRPKGFPRFARGAFDFEVGRTAPPSFHLATQGRSVAYHYTGTETRVRPNTDYRVVGYIRPDRLQRSRACLSAHFLDKNRDPILSTMVRSRYIAASDAFADWVRVDMYLPSAPSDARTIGLIAWTLQEPMWNTSVPPRRHIPRVDVHGGAWFDDITVYALPRVQITTSAPGHVLSPDGEQELHIILADDEDAGLTGRLSITAADGGLVETHRVPVVVRGAVEAVRIPVSHLQPGAYRAQLDVLSEEGLAISRSLRFVRLGPLQGRSHGSARPFGVVLDPRYRSDADVELALLRQQAARSVKFPVWSGIVEDPPTSKQRRSADRLLQELVKDGFALTGVFFGPPSAIVLAAGAYPRSLVDLLTDERGGWQDHLAGVVAPHASVYRWWQVGPDGENAPGDGDKTALAVTRLADAMRRFVTVPLLALPMSTTLEPSADTLPVQQVALSIGHEIQANGLERQIERFNTLGYDHLSVFVESLPGDRYRRIPRLADWAQKIIAARHAGADAVFVPQTWSVRQTIHGQVSEPTEEYLILRTIADVISDADPGQRVRVAPGVQCLAFHDGDSTVLAMWDDQAPPEGREYTIQMGRADRRIDLRGRTATLDHDEHGRQIITLSPTPVFVDGVERWLIDLRTSLSLQPGHVESGVELAHHTIELVHRGKEPISGTVYLETPESWEISPRTHAFNLMPNRTVLLPVEVNYPHNEPAGVKDILAKITLNTTSYYLEVPLPVDVGLEDVDISGTVIIEGDDFVLRHVLTNRSKRVLHFRGTAAVPGRQRQYRPIPNLRPGDTQTVEYRFARGRMKSGTKIRIGLREMNDGPRTHTLEMAIP